MKNNLQPHRRHKDRRVSCTTAYAALFLRENDDQARRRDVRPMAGHRSGVYEWIADSTSDRLDDSVAGIGCVILKGQAQLLRVYISSLIKYLRIFFEFVSQL